MGPRLYVSSTPRVAWILVPFGPHVGGRGGAPGVPLQCGGFGVLRGRGWRPPSAPVAAWEGGRGRTVAEIGRYLGQRRVCLSILQRLVLQKGCLGKRLGDKDLEAIDVLLKRGGRE